MSHGDNVKLGFTVEVVQGDALTFKTDVLAVKLSPLSGGLGAWFKKYLPDDTDMLPGAEEYRVWFGRGITQSEYVLMLGAPPSFSLRYPQLRDLGRRFLEALWTEGLDVKHMTTTVHGVRTGVGLDEVEAFRSLLLGMSDAYTAGHYPPTLERITFIEMDENRARLLKDTLQKFLPAEPPSVSELLENEALPSAMVEEVEPALAIMAGPESFEPEFRAPEANDLTPHVFVAMPFKNDYDDQFYLAIQPCIKDQGLLCERMDLEAFTGAIVDQMLERIRTARLMIALLDGGNPNVYLEVGYAWGVNTPTLLIAREGELLPFDVRGHRVLIYDKIYLLKEKLTEELKQLME